jgi:hypothetical protein
LAALTHYHAPEEEARKYAEVARSLPSKSLRDEASLREIFKPEFLTYLEFEQACDVVRQWHSGFIPGLLQTEEYAYYILSKVFLRLPKDAEKIIEARLERQQLLQAVDGPSFRFILDEAAFIRPFEDSRIMKKQVAHILALNEGGASESTHAQVRMVPLAAGPHPGIRGPFILLEFQTGGEDDVLFMETPRGDYFSRDDAESTESYSVMFQRLEDISIGGKELATHLQGLTL